MSYTRDQMIQKRKKNTELRMRNGNVVSVRKRNDIKMGKMGRAMGSGGKS